MRLLGGAVCLTAVAVSLAGCRGSLPDPPAGSRVITVRTPDGIVLHGVEVGDAANVAVLSHGATGTKEDFYGLAAAFAKDGWRAIAYDARGVGESTGEQDDAARDTDLAAIVDYARRTGAERLLLAGGSLGASLVIAMAQDLRPDAIVSLSAPATTFGALDAARAIGTSVPAFVAAAEENQPYADDARRIADALGIRPVIVSGDGHGTGMFRDHPDLIARIVRFADERVGSPA